jgi:hypothetical protein
VPAAHATHVGGELAVPGAVCFVPAAHVPWGKHALWLAVLEYVSFGHGVQVWSLEDVPAMLTY